MRIDVLVLDGVFDLGLAALLDTLGTANDLGTEGSRVEVRTIGVRRRARTWWRLAVPLAPARGAADVTIVPALGCKTPGTIAAALERADVADAGALLRERARSGSLIGAACTGTFVLAASTLLDGHHATTTWWLAPPFRAMFPRVELDDSRMVVESGRIVTAGAALAHVDLALWLVRRRSPALAERVARFLIVDERASQAAFAIPDHLAHDDAVVKRFERWARRHLADRFSLATAARSVGASERTLARRLRAVLGRSPLGYVQDLRVERAVHRLRTSEASIEEIATEVGYRDGVTLRTLLRRKTGVGVRALRHAPRGVG
jgi:transcriptional regulator GlxA family with amidase domain